MQYISGGVFVLWRIIFLLLTRRVDKTIGLQGAAYTPHA